LYKRLYHESQSRFWVGRFYRFGVQNYGHYWKIIKKSETTFLVYDQTGGTNKKAIFHMDENHSHYLYTYKFPGHKGKYYLVHGKGGFYETSDLSKVGRTWKRVKGTRAKK
jgi:hypothetical protein